MPPHLSTTTSPVDRISGSESSRARLLLSYEAMKDEIDEILNNEAAYQELVANLKHELSISKRAYSGLEAEYSSLEAAYDDLEKHRDDLQNQLKPNRIVVLIDGDGAIFDTDLIAEGVTGGHRAASQISEAVMNHLPGRSQHQLSVYVFLNKRGLAETFGRVSRPVAKQRLEDFIVGFNQAAERFVMADVGNTKEAADAKIKALLESEIRLPQTDRVIFGGSHDNGYMTSLLSHITSGLKDKIILLQSYDEVATSIKSLDLPLLTIPGLFLPEKLNVYVSSASPPIFQMDLPADTSPPRTSGLQPTSWSAVAGSGRTRAASHARSDSGRGLTPNTADTNVPLSSSPARRPPTGHKGRKIDRSLPVWRQTPGACTLHYLSTGGCKYPDCPYAHDYQFNEEDMKELAKNAKKVVCTSALKGDFCVRGNDCIYGHKCPYLGRCPYVKEGTCRFKARGMHTPDDDEDDD